MPVTQPYDWSGLWAATRPQTEWPATDEDAVDVLGQAWSNAGAAFSAAGAPVNDGLVSAWRDDTGQFYGRTVDQLRSDSRNAGAGMSHLGTLATSFAGDVRDAKKAIVDAIDRNSAIYITLQAVGFGLADDFASDMAATLNAYLDEVASQIAARGAGGPEQTAPTVGPVLIGGPPPPADPGQRIGAEREQRVAELTGGTVIGPGPNPGLLIKHPAHGTTDVDVIGPDGTFIAVGGPAKAHNLSKFTKNLLTLQWAAQQQGVAAEVALTRDTPPAVVEEAQRILGPDNVFLFD